MKARFFGMVSLLLAMAAGNSAWAACDVTLISVTGSMVALKANCGAVALTNINWFRGATSLTGGFVAASATDAQEIAYTTPALIGTNVYTAQANDGNVVAGKPAVVTISNPVLTVGGNAGGTVTSSPAGITCIDGAGTCSKPDFPANSAVVLTAAADGTHSFSGWGGDCSGTGTCTVAMNASRTVTATFGNMPVNGTCGTPAASATPPAAGLCTTGTATGVADPGTASAGNWTWGCNGANGGTSTSSTACSAPKIVGGVCGTVNGLGPVSTEPTGTAACNPGTATNMTAGATQYTWTCAGFNTGASSGQCAVNITPTNGACGTANGQNVASSPTGAAACSAGTSTTPTNPSNTFSWTCTGLAGGSSQSCTANQIINGACGSSNGGSFSSAPTSNLCSAGNATAVTGAYSWSCTGINNGTTAACSATQSSSSSCGSGEVYNEAAGDRNWTTYNSGGTYPGAGQSFQASGAAGVALKFVPTTNRGIVGLAGYGNGAQVDKEIVISQCPHNFTTSASGQPLYYCRRTGTDTFYQWTSVQGLVMGNECTLTSGQTYYLNVRPLSQSGEMSISIGYSVQ